MKGESGEVILGRYRIDHPLGHGGFGRIHAGRQVSLNRDVAIKSVRPDLADAGALRERFRREAVLAASINHPNVVTIHDFGIDEDGDLILVMERLKGWTLLDELRKNPRPAMDRLVARIRQAALGLGAAHEAGIVHRDVKPSNLFLVAPGTDAERLKVIDFGILRVAPGARPDLDDLDDLTRSDAFIGTPDYAAPEMILARSIDARADQYALALVAYLMLTGRKGFSGRDPAALLARVSRRPDPIESGDTARMDGLTAPIRDVLHRALTPDPEGRYPTIRAFAEALASAANASGPIESWAAEPTGLITPTGTPVSWPTNARTPPMGTSTPSGTTTAHPPGLPKGRVWHLGALIGAVAVLAVAGALWGKGVLDPKPTTIPSTEAIATNPEAVAEAAPPDLEATPPAPETEPEPALAATATEPESTPPATATAPESAPHATATDPEPDSSATAAAAPRDRAASRTRAGIRTARPESVAAPGAALAPSPAPATLTFNATPWAEIRINGRPVGVTPLMGVTVPPGRHRIEFAHPTLGTRVQVYTLAPGEARIFRMRLDAPEGS